MMRNREKEALCLATTGARGHQQIAPILGGKPKSLLLMQVYRSVQPVGRQRAKTIMQEAPLAV